jgi:hypothetical protein
MRRALACLAGLLAALAAPACAERLAPDASAGAAPASSRAGAAAGAGALRFIENDAPRAQAEAKQRGVPLFVEAWAPW